jgi:hypothetical protein
MSEPNPTPCLHAGRSVRKRLLRWLASAALSLALLEVTARVFTSTSHNGMPCIGRFPLLPYRPTAELVRARLEQGTRSTYIVADPELGWTIGRSGVSRDDAGELQYTSNSQGVRAAPDRVYAHTPPPGKVRIVTVGDSFTHSDEVGNAQTWQHALESRRGDLELLNLGVPGYGTDQALLRWRRDGRCFESQFVILGIWPENVCRNLSVIRYYLVPTEGYTSKPRLLVEGAGLRVINSPVLDRDELIETLVDPESRPLLANDSWYSERETQPSCLQGSRTFRIAQSLWALRERQQARRRLYSGADPSGIDITVAIAAQFAREVRAAGSTPLVVLIPMRDLLPMHTDSAMFPLVKALREHGIDVLDLGPDFGRAARERGLERIYTAQGHHSAEGNSLFADVLERQLQPRIESEQR